MTDGGDRSRESYRVPARDVECVSCHSHFLTRAGSRTLLCFTCRARFHSSRPARVTAYPDQGGTL